MEATLTKPGTKKSDPKSGWLPLGLSLLAAFAAAISAGAAAYQTSLLRDAQVVAYAANAQSRKLDACAEAISYLANSLETQRAALILLGSDLDGLEDELGTKVKFANYYKDELGPEHSRILRAHAIRLQLLFPENPSLTDTFEALGVFEYSYHNYLMSQSFYESGTVVSSDLKQNELSVREMREILIDEGMILGLEDMEKILVEISAGVTELNMICTSVAQTG